MRTLRFIHAIALLLIVFSSCKRDVPEQEKPQNPAAVTMAAKDLKLPANFSFQNEKTLNVKVKVANAKAGEKYVIKIYGDVPATGKLISTGITNSNAEYALTIRIPSYEEFIYIEKINPDGSSQFEKVKASQFSSAVFNNKITTPYVIRKAGSGMSCTSRCDRTLNNYSGGTIYVLDEYLCLTGTISGNVNIELISGAVVNISANITGNVYINIPADQTVKVCGSGTITTIDCSGNLYFLESSSVTVTNFAPRTGSETKNWSENLRFSNLVVPHYAKIENHGKMYFMGAVETEYSDFTNNGQLFFMGSSGLITNAAVTTITNNNYMYVENNIGNYPNNIINNNCHLEVKGMIDNEGSIINKGYIKTGRFTQNKHDAAFLELNNASMMSAGEVYLNTGFIKGTGTGRSKVKATYSELERYYTQVPTVEGTVDYCDANGVEINSGVAFTSSAALSCGGHIATSTCNPEGFGSVSSQDSDNDGVADGQDEYPNDASRAFNGYYPNATSTATVAYEDLWPALADYDFNDLVLAFNIQQVLNSNNEVVDYKVKMKVKAIGGTFENGFGFQLDDVAPSEISAVTGQVLSKSLITRNANNTEAGQNKAVIICYDSPEPVLHRPGSSMFNTIKTNPQAASDSIYINITFTSPVADTKLGMDKFNPFIFTAQRRGYEVHLGNFKPTDLATTSVFGTFVDRTNPSNNIYYKNEHGMPWGIMIPGDFAYPAEKAVITDAYNYFDDWAISGGTNYTNWYTNAPGNRNANYIY